MSGPRRLFRLWRPDHAKEVRDELAFHLESAVAESVAAGMPEREARTAAIRRFGDIKRISRTLNDLSHEGERIMRRKEWWTMVAQDLRFGIRQLRRNPGFTLVILGTLALGIGANTAIFSIVDSVLLKPLPYASADRIVTLRQSNGNAGGMVVPFPNFLTWERETRTFQALGGTVWQFSTLTSAGEPQRLRGNRASAGYWNALYIPPALGRYYTATDDRYGGSHVVVLSYGLWESAFGRDSSIIGRTILLDDVPHLVVAVAAAGYSLSSQSPQFWVPLASSPDEANRYNDHELTVVGLLRPGLTAADGARELDRIEAEIRRTKPDGATNGSVVALPMLSIMVPNAGHEYLLLLGAVGLVLLIACCNVANLLLARAMTRRAEFTVRSALGAASRRIVSQLLVESALLAFGGAILGVGIGALGIRFLVANTPPGVPRITDASLDSTVLAFTAALTVLSALAFGLAPALRASRTDLQTTLRESGRESRRVGRDGLRGGLIIAEIAIALVLLTGAGLLVRSSMLLNRVAPGFDPANVLTLQIGLPAARYPSDPVVAAAFTQINQATLALPGVAAAGMISRIPIGSGGADCSVWPNGIPDTKYDADFRSVTPGYFAAMRTPLFRGRLFTAADGADAPLVVVINRGLATKLFGGADPIGQQLVHCVGASNSGPPPSRTVVGVIADVHAGGLDADPVDEVYYPQTQLISHSMTLVVRGGVPVVTLLPAIRRAVATIDPHLPLANIATMPDIIGRSTAPLHFSALLLVILGGTGLVLAAVGIYGVIAYFVTQRTHEMGVRMALGASAGRVRGMVLRQGLALAASGVLAGEIGAFFFTRPLATMVYGVTVRDPITFALAGVLLGAIALVASAVPAWRATRIDPLKALRG